tara:strand:- start:24655 stop:25017 length:363 start_codon:yes stop_codon:yes gene_type:complete
MVVGWQKVEGALIFIVSIGLFTYIDNGLSWWMALLIFFAPDLSFAGYLLKKKVGAFCYNFAHIYALGAVLFMIGITQNMPQLGAVGALWLGHSGFDRMLGYGLKTDEGFAFTHLGKIGKI